MPRRILYTETDQRAEKMRPRVDPHGQEHQQDQQRGDRIRGWIAVACIGALTVFLLLDVIALPSNLPTFRTSGNDYLAVLDSQSRNQIVNFVIGAVLHEGVGAVKTVIVPADLASLSARPGDKMLGGVQPAVQLRLLEPLVGGTVVQRAYDPRVDDATIAAWRSSGRLGSYPRQVYLLRPAQPASGTWVLLTDAARLRVFIVSAVDAPAGVPTR